MPLNGTADSKPAVFRARAGGKLYICLTCVVACIGLPALGDAETISLHISQVPPSASGIAVLADGNGMSGDILTARAFAVGTTAITMDIAVPATGAYRLRAVAFTDGHIAGALSSGKTSAVATSGTKASASIVLYPLMVTLNGATPSTAARGSTVTILLNCIDSGDLLEGKKAAFLTGEDGAGAVGAFGTADWVNRGPGFYTAALTATLPLQGDLFLFRVSTFLFASAESATALYLYAPGLDRFSAPWQISLFRDARVRLSVSNIPAAATSVAVLVDGVAIKTGVVARQDFAAGTESTVMDIDIAGGGPYRLRAVAFVGEPGFSAALSSGKTSASVPSGGTATASLMLSDFSVTIDASTPSSAVAGAAVTLRVNCVDAGDVLQGKQAAFITGEDGAGAVGHFGSSYWAMQPGGIYTAVLRTALPQGTPLFSYRVSTFLFSLSQNTPTAVYLYAPDLKRFAAPWQIGLASLCSYVLDPVAASFPASATSGALSISTNSSFCPWNAASLASWIVISPTGVRAGNGVLPYTIAANPNSRSRTAIIQVAGRAHTVTQSGVPCAYSLNSSFASLAAVGGNGTVGIVTTAPDCPWTASSNAPWATITTTTGTGTASISYAVAANTGSMQRTAVLSIAGKLFTVTQAGGDRRTPTAVFRDIWGDIEITSYPSATLKRANGIVESDPGAAQNSAGDTIIVARDIRNAVWVNLFNATTQAWAGWTYAGGIIEGTPAVTVAPNGTAYLVVRGAIWHGYWLNSYTPGIGLSSWVHLGGIFATDPAVAAAPDGAIYIMGTDGANNVLSGYYRPGSPFPGWRPTGGILQGKLSLAVGMDGAAYVTGRDFSGGVWVGRAQGATWTGWHAGGGFVINEPQIAPGDNGKLYVAALGWGGAVWHQAFHEGAGNGWEGWTFTNGWLQSASPAISNGELYISGRDSNNSLWWYRAGDHQWTWIGNAGLAIGNPVAAGAGR